MEERLKTAVVSVVSDSPGRKEVRQLVHRCFRMARIYLRRRARSGRLDPEFFGLSLDDLALDCVADLFERDDSGRFPQLAGYFEGRGLTEMSDTEVLGATRRIVFSKVSEGLYRRYREADPGLAKMIRNLRYAAKRVPDVDEERRAGVLWFVFDATGRGDDPIMPPDFLETRMFVDGLPNMDLQDVLGRVRVVLEAHPAYSLAYPVVGLAHTIRRSLKRLSEPPDNDWSPMPSLHAEDIGRFISRSTKSVKQRLRPTYLEKRKVDRSTFDAYFEAAQEILEAQCISDPPENDSYFEHLKSCVTALSYESYRRTHRARFEYIVKQTREQFIRDIRPHW